MSHAVCRKTVYKGQHFTSRLVLPAMATNYPSSGSSGGWTGEDEENEQERQMHDRVMEERAVPPRTRQLHGDWCQCQNCFPGGIAKSTDDVTCCQESPQAVEVCQEFELFGEKEHYKCIIKHSNFRAFCTYRRNLLNRRHLYKAQGYRQGSYNGQLRYVAHHGYTVWIHGHLGFKNRRRVPHYVAKIIQEHFPEANPNHITD